MFWVGRQLVGESYNPEAGITVVYFFPTRLEWFHKSGGLKASWFFGSENSPIIKIDWEQNQHMIGAGNLNLAYVPFAIDADDYIKLYYKNILFYQAIIDNSADKKGGDIDLIPYSQRFSELIMSATYVAQTVESMLEDIIETYQDDTEIGWNAAYIDTGSSTTYDIEFEGVSIKKAIDDLIGKLQNRYWGVNASNTFVVYQQDTSSDVDDILTNNDCRIFSSVKEKKDYSKIKETRYKNVYRKNAAGEKVDAGDVGYDAVGGTYPTLSIEKLIRKKESVITVSELLDSDAQATDYAYAKLESEAQIRNTVNVNDVNINEYTGEIGKYIKVIDDEEKVMNTIIDCESISSWTGAYLETDDYIEGSNCIYLYGYDPTSSTIIYDFGETMRYFQPEFLAFMAKSEESTGKILQVGWHTVLANVWDSPYDLYIDTANVWEQKIININANMNIRYLGLRLTTTQEKLEGAYNAVGFFHIGESFQTTPYKTRIFFDRFQLYMLSKETYEGAIVQIKYKIEEEGELKQNLVLGSYNTQINDSLFEMNRKLEKAEIIQQV